LAASARGELLDRGHAARHAGLPLSRLRVRLTPSGGGDRIEGSAADDNGPYLKARVRAAPEDNKANRALEALIAKAFGVAKSKVTVSRGQTARLKVLEIEAASEADIAAFVARYEEKS